DNMSQSHDDNHRNNSHDRSDRENGSDTDNMSQRNDGNSEDTSVSNDPHLHHHGIIDPHAWFDPLIAIEWLRIIKESLGEIDPENKTTYEANFQSWSAKIQELDESIATKMTITKPVYIVYHDAYQYFEERYNVSPIVSLKDQSLGESGARHISRFIDQVEGISEICVLVEPFFDENLINTVAGDIVFNIYTVDPSGINFEDSSMLYFEILNSIADSLENC
ncbi:MAG: zinc ABC transporter substrate-binding protein, partial [Rhodobacteraceae bacterium]|nr:zinc ABC transporter substrate-binding protein [Paracoccaceae bacterium]